LTSLFDLSVVTDEAFLKVVVVSGFAYPWHLQVESLTLAIVSVHATSGRRAPDNSVTMVTSKSWTHSFQQQQMIAAQQQQVTDLRASDDSGKRRERPPSHTFWTVA
jgi:hypothetical protein